MKGQGCDARQLLAALLEIQQAGELEASLRAAADGVRLVCGVSAAMVTVLEPEGSRPPRVVLAGIAEQVSLGNAEQALHFDRPNACSPRRLRHADRSSFGLHASSAPLSE